MRPIASSPVRGRTRSFLLLGLLTVLLEAPELSAQSARKVLRIGFLSEGSATASTATMEALRQGLRELGYVDGQNIAKEPMPATSPSSSRDASSSSSISEPRRQSA